MVVVVAYGSGGREEEGREMRALGFRAGGSNGDNSGGGGEGVRREDGDRGGAAAAARGRVPEGSRCGRKEFGGGDGGCQKTLQFFF